LKLVPRQPAGKCFWWRRNLIFIPTGPFCARASIAIDSRSCPLGQQKSQIQMSLFRFMGEIDFAAL
jgi:hypothetical protein